MRRAKRLFQCNVTDKPHPLGTATNRIVNRVPKTGLEQALARLEPKDRGEIDYHSATQDQNALEILRVFPRESEKKEKECQNKQWKYIDGRGQEVLVRDRMYTLLLNMSKYTAVADLVVQSLPSVVSLAWGDFKIHLQA